MSDEEIFSVMNKIKQMCRKRYEDIWVGCDGCTFYTKRASKKGNHCQICALLGNMSGIPAYWQMNKITEIWGETE